MMTNLPHKFFVFGSLLIILGMAHGIILGIKSDYTFAPLHAHVNLLGGFGAYLFGLFYKAFPNAASDPLAKLHFWLATAGFLIFFIGIYLAIADIQIGGPKDIVGHVGGTLATLALIVFFIISARQTKSSA